MSTVPVLYHINLNGFFTLYVKEIKIAIWDAELVFSTGLKSGGTPGMAILVVEFSNQGYEIRKIFA